MAEGYPLGFGRRVWTRRTWRLCAGNEKAPCYRALNEADARTRTGDPFITSEVLYQLSYVGVAVKQRA
jgi:hypothetical protein